MATIYDGGWGGLVVCAKSISCQIQLQRRFSWGFDKKLRLILSGHIITILDNILKKDQDNILYDIPISDNLKQYLKKGHHLKKSEKNLKTRLKSKVFSLES